jgi:hypothetical protein
MRKNVLISYSFVDGESLQRMCGGEEIRVEPLNTKQGFCADPWGSSGQQSIQRYSDGDC